MNISVIGAGYVGLVIGCGLSDLGNEVMCMDIDKEKIDGLSKGILPIYEPGLKEIFDRNLKKRLFFSSDIKKAVEHGKVIFLALPTPMGRNYEADLSAIEKVSEDIGKHISGYKVIATKSTVPVGTAEKIKGIIKKNLSCDADFDVVSNPEFLREGAAVKDFQNPERTIIGTGSKRAEDLMISIYKPLARIDRPIITTDIRSAELIKYASNAMLATRISFMNQLSRLCDKAGADIKQVAQGMGLDKRIGPRFLQAGIGYGGSCFPKDVKALIHTLKEHSCDAGLFEAVDRINEKQKLYATEKLRGIDCIENKRICIWGISFKPRTDDVREAPSLSIIDELHKSKAKDIRVFDPVASESLRKFYPDIAKKVSIAKNAYDAAEGADCIILATEWDEFRNIDMKKIAESLNTRIMIDGRNIYDRNDMESLGFKYIGIGR